MKAPARPRERGVSQRRPEDAGQQLQRRGLARSVRPDDAQGRAALDLERDIANRPELVLVESSPEDLPNTRPIAEGIKSRRLS